MAIYTYYRSFKIDISRIKHKYVKTIFGKSININFLHYSTKIAALLMFCRNHD